MTNASTKSNKFNAGVAINTPDPITKLRPLPAWGRITQVQSIGWQTYRALLVRLEKRLSNRYQYTVSYTLQRVTDNSFGATSGRHRQQLPEQRAVGFIRSAPDRAEQAAG